MSVQIIGSLLGGRYRLEERLGGGGMGETFRALDTRLRRPVAVKLLHAHLAADPAFVRRLEREARIVASLSHPNIVGAFDHGTGDVSGDGTGDGRPYLVMELVEGEDLHETLAHRLTRAGGPQEQAESGSVPAGAVPLDQAMAIARGVLSALAYAHARGLVHRDVKPSNVLLAADGSVKLADFGIAQAPDETTVTRTGELLGSVHYVAPERLDGGMATPAADVYSAGVLLYRVLAGRLPYEGDLAAVIAAGARRGIPPPLDSFRTDIPAWLGRMVRTALAADPHQRYPSAEEMLQELERGLDLERRAGSPTVVLRRSDPGAVTVPLHAETAAAAGRAGPIPGPARRALPHTPPRARQRRAIAAVGGVAVVSALMLLAALAAAQGAGRLPAAATPGAAAAPSLASDQTRLAAAATTVPPSPTTPVPVASQVVSPGQATQPTPGSQGPADIRAAVPQLRDLRTALQATGGRGKVGDVVNELRELEKKLLEGNPRDAQKEAAELRRKVEEWRGKGELDPAVADRVLPILARLAS